LYLTIAAGELVRPQNLHNSSHFLPRDNSIAVYDGYSKTAYKSRGIDMKMMRYAAIALTGLVLAGCSEYSGPRERSGALIGGVTGGILGSAIGDGDAGATILGAALGAVIGGSVGRDLDAEDKRYAYRAADRSFRSGRYAAWENPNTGHRGQIKLRRSYERNDRTCRDFDHTIWVDGDPQLIEGTACEMADGSWRVVG
jgi:surface antigen